jgi:LPS export ABC transporter permease LptF/LPS export ABC transporter permease LptG
MKILDRYIFRETLTPALIGLLALTFVFFSQQVGWLLEIIVRQSATFKEIVALCLAIIPNVLTFTIPMAVLVGILTGFGRMSSDSESTAFRAAGLSMGRLLRPVMFFALVAWTINLALTVWISPTVTARSRQMRYSLAMKQVSLEVKPRVFNESLANIVLYVQDVAANGLEWRGIMLADTRKAAEPQVTFAKSGTLVADEATRTFQLTLTQPSTYTVSPRPGESTFSNSPSHTTISIAMPAAPPPPQRPSVLEADTRSLWDQIQSRSGTGEEQRAAAVEFHRRLALPFACLSFALIGLPLGVSTSRGSKSMGLVLSLLLMLAYYLILAGGTKIAGNSQVSPFFGVWFGNIVLAALGVLLLIRADYEGENRVMAAFESAAGWVQNKFAALRTTRKRVSRWAYSLTHHPKFFMLLDIYVIRGFWFFFALVLVVFVALFIIITLFQLLPDIVKNNIDSIVVGRYFLFLLPQILYWVVPLTVLLAILINLGTLTKTNEILAVKAGAISLYRMTTPLLMMSLLLSASIYLLQDFILPEANQRQQDYHDLIKGKAPQTYRDPERKWMAGSLDRIYHYNYFNPDQDIFGSFSLFEFEPHTLQLKRWVFAGRAEWTGFQWQLRDGWIRNMVNGRPAGYQPFSQIAFAEIDTPDYFKKEVRMADQMTYVELRNYVDDLKQSGFDVSTLTVDLYRKLSFPLVSFIMAIIGIPFSFKTGKRGAFYGIGLCIAVGIFYWATFELFNKLGGINQLSPMIAAWFPNLIFGVGGVWLMLRVKT